MDVLIPLKRLDRAKTRLAAFLDAPTRSRLMRALVDHTVTEARSARSVDEIILVSSDPESASIAAAHGILHFDDRHLPWNDALAAAIAESVSSEAVLILSADLPLVSAADVEALIAAVPERGIAIARARDAGTNAVGMRPAGLLETTFGSTHSAALHAELAAAAGSSSVMVDRDGLAFDLDSPEDIRELLRRDAPRAIRAALEDVSAA